MNDSIRLKFLVPASLVALSACATSGPVASVPVGLLRTTDVLVACEVPDPSVRAICEEQLADEVTVRGSRPTRLAAEARQPNGSVTEAQLLQAARTSNAPAVVVLSLAPVAVEDPGPTLSLGFGGFSRSVGGGVGIAAPLGAARTSIGYAGRATVVEVASGRTVWTGRANAPASDDLPSQLGGLSVNVLDLADRAGLF